MLYNANSGSGGGGGDGDGDKDGDGDFARSDRTACSSLKGKQ